MCVTMLAGIFAIAATAAALPPEEELEVDGYVRLGIQNLEIDGDRAKFNEYRNVDDGFGFVAEEVWLRGYKGPWNFFVKGLNLDRDDDRSARAEGGYYGRFNLGLGWDETPHHFAEDVAFLGTYQGDGMWSVLDQVRREFLEPEFPLGSFANDPFPTATGQAALLDFIGGASRLDLGLVRETVTLDMDYTAFEDFNIRADYLHESRNGFRPMSTGLYRRDATGATAIGGVGENFLLYGLEFPEPINYDTDKFIAGLNYRKDRWSADLSYRYLKFDNNVSTVSWDNPLLFTSVDAIQNGAAQSRMDLFPSYDQHFVSFTGGVSDLPLNSRFTTTASWSLLTQDDDFLAYTVNDALTVLGVGPNAGALGSTLALPANDLDGEVSTVFVNALLSSRPVDPLKLDFKVNYYTYMNDSDKIHWADGWARIGESEWASPSNFEGPPENQLFNRVPDWWRIRPSFDASYKINKMFLLLADYRFEGYRRNDDRNADTNEHIVGGRLKVNPADWSSLRVGYHWSDRQITGGYTPAPAKQFFEWDQLRMFDQSDRTRHKVDAYVSVDPIERLSLGFSLDWVLDDYDSSFYGLQEREGYTTGVDAGYVFCDDRVSVFAYYARDDYDTDSLLRAKSDELGGGSFAILANDFRTKIADDTNTVGGKISLGLIPHKLSFDVSADYSVAEAEFNNSNPNFTAGNPCPGVCDNTTSSATAFDWPNQEVKTTQVRADLDYHWTENLSTGLRYLYQRFDLDDSFVDNVLPYGNPGDVQGNSLDYFIFLDANYSDYDAHLVTLTVAYEF
jgi:MtrB/PioB family decaheme-associated outer membrane protein